MSATVVDLASRRPQPRTRETCGACARGTDGGLRECYPHRLESLALRLRAAHTSTEVELLVPAPDVATVLADALSVLQGITAECLGAEKRPMTTRTRPRVEGPTTTPVAVKAAPSTTCVVRSEALPAWHNLGALLADLNYAGTPTPCQVDPDPFTSEDHSERAEAAEACRSGCPVIDACAAFADAQGETSHVWAGIDRTRRITKRKPAAA